MKIVTVIVFTLLLDTGLHAQPVPDSLAYKIARRMKDSLVLSDVQRGKLYVINMQLNNAKMAVRRQYANVDSVRLQMQAVENTRDSLYSQVLTNEQFILYRQKKNRLVNTQLIIEL